MEKELVELRMRALELAEKTVHQPYLSGTGPGDYYRDKDIGEIFSRAGKFLRFALDNEDESTKTLIDKLKGVLCSDK